MKKNHFFSILLCIIFTLFTFAACKPSKEDVVGTYVGSYTYSGTLYTVAIILEEDGTYAKATVKNGVLSSSETGDYEIKGREIRLYDDDSVVYHGSYTAYKYKKDVLKNNGHKFVKE